MYCIHIDITDLAFHKGTLSGIQRVEYYLVRQYLKNPKVNFVCWSDRHGWFVSLSTDVVDRLIKTIDRASQTTTASLNTGDDRPSDFRRITLGYITTISGYLRRRIKNLPWVYVWVLKFRPNHFLAKKQIVACRFKPADKLIIACGFWGNKAYESQLEKLSMSGVELSQVVHDMIPVVMPHVVNEGVSKAFTDYMRRVLPITSHIIAVSKNTIKDIKGALKSWGLDTKASYVLFRLGDNPLVNNTRLEKPAWVKIEPYILSVGTLEPRKNHRLLLQTYRLAEERSVALPHLYLAGRVGWNVSELLHDLSQDPLLKAKITFIEEPTDLELAWLYQRAQLTIFPSFYEGWGLPIAESLAYGKVTLCSKTSSMPEVGNTLADYFSPNSPEELLKLLIKYDDSSRLISRQKAISNGYKTVDWSASVQTLAQQMESAWSVA